MEIVSSSPVISGISIRQKISNSDDKTNKNDHETGQRSTEEDNDIDTPFEFKFDHHLQIANSNSDSPDGSLFKDSPADHLFRNGILLPHSFPVQPMFSYCNGTERRRSCSYQRSVSRTSSVGSKDSLISSRSNSTNSRSSTSSCSSSARTSISDTTNFDRKYLNNNNAMREYYHKKRPQPAVLDHAYGSSRRWQFITPMPVMTQETISSRPKRQKVTSTTTKKKTSATGSASNNSWPLLRLFRYLLSLCMECHAMEPSIRS